MVCILLCYIFSVNCAIKHVLNSTNVSVSVKYNIVLGFQLYYEGSAQFAVLFSNSWLAVTIELTFQFGCVNSDFHN